jgi:hypothetical protein
MNVDLTLRLIEMNVIKSGTEVDAYYRTSDLSGSRRASVPGNFMVVRAVKTRDGIFFEVSSTEAGRRTWVQPEDIMRVDGMDPLRIAEIYHLDAHGRSTREHRRTRKPRGVEA